MPISAKQKRVDFVHSLLFYPVLWVVKGQHCHRVTILYGSKKAAEFCGFFPIDKKSTLLKRGLVTERSLEGFPVSLSQFFYRPVDGFSLMGISLFVMVQIFPR